MTAEFGPLFAYVHPHDLEWWCWHLAKAQAGELELTASHRLGYVSDLSFDSVMDIEDVFPSSSVEPGHIQLRQMSPGCV